MRRRTCIFGLLIASMLPLTGCGERISQPMDAQGHPIDPPEPPEPPAETGHQGAPGENEPDSLREGPG